MNLLILRPKYKLLINIPLPSHCHFSIPFFAHCEAFEISLLPYNFFYRRYPISKLKKIIMLFSPPCLLHCSLILTIHRFFLPSNSSFHLKTFVKLANFIFYLFSLHVMIYTNHSIQFFKTTPPSSLQPLTLPPNPLPPSTSTLLFNPPSSQPPPSFFEKTLSLPFAALSEPHYTF